MKKKKILIILLVLLVSLSVVFAAISCNNHTTTPPVIIDDDDDDDDDVEKESFSAVFDAIVKAADKTISNVGSINEAAYFAATLYANIKIGDNDPINYSLTIKGNFGTAENSEGYILVKDEEHNRNLVQIYVAGDSNVFVAELVSQNTAGIWYKLDQASGTDFVKDYFTKLPGWISTNMAGMVTSMKAETKEDKKTHETLYPYANMTIDTVLSTMLGSIGDTIATYGGILMDVEYPEAFVAGTLVDGDYNLAVNMSQIGQILPLLTLAGLNINTIADMLDMDGVTGDSIMSIADIILPMLIGEKLVVNDKGEITGIVAQGVQPSIEIKTKVAGSALSAIALEYVKADDTTETGDSSVSIKVGVKDVSVSNAVSTSSLKPSALNMTNAKNPDIKLTMDLGMAGKTGLENVTITGYVSPQISWSEADGFAVSDVMAYASAEIDGIDGEIAIVYDAETSTLAFDLTGVYEALNIDVPAEGAIYYNSTLSLDELLNGKSDPAPDPIDPVDAPANDEGEEESTNLIDQLVDAVIGVLSGDIMAVISKAGDALNLYKTVSDIFEVCIDDTTEGTYIVNVLGLMSSLLGLDAQTGTYNTILSGSSFLTFADRPITDYLVAADSLTLIEVANGLTPGTIGEWFVEISGIAIGTPGEDETVTDLVGEYLVANGLKIKLQTYFGATLDTTTKGAGFKLSITKADGTDYASFGLRGTLVAHADSNFGTIDATNGIDLDTDAGWDFFMDQLEILGDAYLALA